MYSNYFLFYFLKILNFDLFSRKSDFGVVFLSNFLYFVELRLYSTVLCFILVPRSIYVGGNYVFKKILLLITFNFVLIMSFCPQKSFAICVYSIVPRSVWVWLLFLISAYIFLMSPEACSRLASFLICLCFSLSNLKNVLILL